MIHTVSGRVRKTSPPIYLYDDNLAELPRATVDTTFPTVTGTTYTVSNDNASGAGSMANALSSAVGGDEIVIATNLTRTATLPNRGDSGVVLIRSDNAAWQSASTTRITSNTNMRKMTAPSGGACFDTATSAHGYRFVGIEMVANASVFTYNVAQIGNSETSSGAMPSGFIFDRCYIHGDATIGARRGISLNANNSAVINCYLFDFKEVGADTQAILVINSEGPLLIHNNYLEGAGENVMFGGGDPTVANLIPCDITITQNHFFKPTAWTATSWTVKNILEFKTGKRALVEKNVLENNWPSGQVGYGILITPRNQDGGAAWTQVADITFRYNHVINTGSAFSILGDDDVNVSLQTKRISIRHNIIDVTGYQSAQGRIFLIVDGDNYKVEDLNVKNNTMLISGGTSTGLSYIGEDSSFKLNRFTMVDNIFSGGTLGLGGAGTGGGNDTLSTHCTNYTVQYNIFIGQNAANYPATNISPQPANVAAVGFTDHAGGDWSLSGSSDYLTSSSTGGRLGADATSVYAYAATAVAGS